MRMIKDYLDEPGCRGVARSTDGRIRLFRRRGVVDLLELLEAEPEFLDGASVADRVIGRGAALLLLRGGVGSVYAQVISTGALGVLREAGVTVSFGAEAPYIKNQKGGGQCPVEALTAHVDDPQEAFRLIKTFIETKRKAI